MTLEVYLRRLLLRSAGVAQLVAARVYAQVLPQTREMPAAVLTFVSGTDDDQVLGDAGSGTRSTRVQVDAWATTREGSTALAEALRTALDAHAGAAAGLEVQTIVPGAPSWEYEPETKLYVTRADFEVWWS